MDEYSLGVCDAVFLAEQIVREKGTKQEIQEEIQKLKQKLELNRAELLKYRLVKVA